MPVPRIRPLEEQNTIIRDALARAAFELHACPSCRALFRTGPGHCPLDGARLEACSGDPLLGSVVAEEYEVVAPLGQGAMGRVYRAVHLGSGRAVAMKTLYGDVAASSAMRDRFRLEARLAGRIHHRNVVSALDFVEMGAAAFIVLELVEGGCLDDWVSRSGPVGRDTALALAAGTLRGLAALHAHGVVHRDIKPSNLLLHPTSAGYIPRITDLGVARLAGAVGASTGTGFVVGSPSYMAPEQARGSSCDARSDIYAVGATLHAILTGSLPFEGEPHRILYDKATNACPALGQVDGLDRDLRRLIACFTANDPDERPGSALEALEAVERVRLRAPEPTRARRRSGTTSARRGPSRLPAVVAVTAAIAMGGLVGASPLPQWAMQAWAGPAPAAEPDAHSYQTTYEVSAISPPPVGEVPRKLAR